MVKMVNLTIDGMAVSVAADGTVTVDDGGEGEAV